MNKTLQYYSQNANSFAATTQSVDFSANQERFLSKLPPDARILDFGCGAGRDTLFFMQKGYNVTAIDGSPELCQIASDHCGIPVRQMLFQDLSEVEQYDGIWACSSILHLAKPQLAEVMNKMRTALKPSGCIYTSFKYGSFEGYRNCRYFTDFTEELFREFIRDIEGMSIDEQWVSADVRPGRSEEKWLNLILIRI